MQSPVPAAHSAFLERLRETTARDERLLGIAIAGSYVTGTMDEFSDLDLQVVVTDEAYAQLLSERMAFARGLGKLLAGFTGEHVGEPRLLICLYGDPLLHVDFKFVSLSAFATDRVEDPGILWEQGDTLSAVIAAHPCAYPAFDAQWVEDRFWVWIHYGAAKVGRGELFEAVESLSFIRQLALAPLAKAVHGKLPRGSRFLEQEAAAYLPEFEGTLTGKLEPAAILQALRGAVTLYRRLRADAASPGLVRRDAAEDAVTAYMSAVGEMTSP